MPRSKPLRPAIRLVIEKAQVDAELSPVNPAALPPHAEEQYRIRASLRIRTRRLSTWTERLANLREI